MYVDDVIGALLAVAEAPEAVGRALDVGSGRLHSVRHVVETIAGIVGAGVTPASAACPTGRPRPSRWPTWPRPRVSCGWAPATDLDEGLKRTVAWYAG